MAGARRCEFDMQYFPLVLVRGPESVDEEGIRDMFARFDALYRAKKRFAAVIDTTATREVPSAKLRKVLTDLSQASADEARRWSIGTAVVVDSGLVRGLLTAVAWVFESPTPTVHVGTLKEAVDWCAKRLEEAGLELSADAKRFCAGLR